MEISYAMRDGRFRLFPKGSSPKFTSNINPLMPGGNKNVTHT